MTRHTFDYNNIHTLKWLIFCPKDWISFELLWTHHTTVLKLSEASNWANQLVEIIDKANLSNWYFIVWSRINLVFYKHLNFWIITLANTLNQDQGYNKLKYREQMNYPQQIPNNVNTGEKSGLVEEFVRRCDSRFD